MPIYSFKCLNCYLEIEREFKVNDNHDVRCSDCQAYMYKQFTAPAIHFKGDGWGGSK